MLIKLIQKLIPDYSNLKNRAVFGILFVFSFFIRFPFFFRDYIDRDESTFILVAQSWVDGNLPFTELWDLKPPITFLFFAIIIYVFGKSFLAIRLIGALIVAVTAYYSFKITETLATKKTAIWVGIVCVAFLSMIGSLQGVMSEHLCMFFFMPALYLLIKKQNGYWIFLAGVLMGLSVMTKLNMAYTVLLLGLFLLYHQIKKKQYSKAILNSIAYGFGIILIIFLTFLPYYLEGNSKIWWDSVVLAPLEYTNARRYSIANFVPILLLLSTFFFFAWKKKHLNFRITSIQILILAIFSIVFSFINGGRINGHYLIQLHPVALILFGVFVSKITFFKKFDYRPYVFFLLLLLPSEAYLEYTRIIKHKIERGSFFNGEGITVPQYIMDNNMDTERILFLGYHIGYWKLNAKPPTKAATHPSNICRSELFPFLGSSRKTGIEEITYIMEEVQPNTVVIRKNRSIFDPKLRIENRYIDNYLEEHYTLLNTVDKAEIYTRD